MTRLKDEYFKWLYNRIKNQRSSYKKLCYELHGKPFRWFIPNDDNRCEDGLNIREEFLERANVDFSNEEILQFGSDKCTTLEVLVALADRMQFLMDDLGRSTHISKWFFEMIRNLRLYDFTDALGDWEGFPPELDVKIDRILETFMSRTYDWYGTGSLFPMKQRPPRDMAKVEIWYQLMIYLDENYVR